MLHVLTCTIKFLHGKTGNFRWKSKGSHHSISNISENMGCDSRRCSSLSRHHLGTVYFVLSPSLTTFNFIILFMQKMSIRMTCVNSTSAPCTTPSIPKKVINCWREEEPAFLIPSLLLCMHHTYVASICLDFH